MTHIKTKKNIAIFGAFLFTMIIGVGMYISFHQHGIRYTNPRLVETLWWIEILLSLLTLFITIKYFSWKEVGFVKLEPKRFLWFMPLVLVLLAMWGGIFNFLNTNPMTPEQVTLFSLVGFTTLLVGFSEELMFRGIVFSAFWQNKKANSLKAVLVSAFAFSLLHSVNIFAGTTFGATLGQLAFTFIFGLLFGLLRLRLNTIIPLIIFHWLWDFALIGSSVLSYDGNILIGAISAIFIVVLTVILLFLLFKQTHPNTSKNE